MKNPPKEAVLDGDSIDTDPVAGRLVMVRAIEIASSDGRLAIDLSASDWQQAKRELTGELDQP
ncbi:MAG: hypothetical protein D4R65_05845 [Verrucomicrobiaceae bacterium]|nr:MAG: hypothetical protein D4R65_05845 [Verrucomicrobiaceae bacterium]